MHNPFFSPPEHAQIIPLVGCAILISSVDLQKNEGTFKIFENVESALRARHASSVEQSPEWHKANCNFCATGVYF